jgi:hypothetical protein
VLKGRQNGCSTYVGARFYHRVSMDRGVGAYILTHEQPATDVLFDMVSRYYTNCPLKPSTSLERDRGRMVILSSAAVVRKEVTI